MGCKQWNHKPSFPKQINCSSRAEGTITKWCNYGSSLFRMTPGPCFLGMCLTGRLSVPGTCCSKTRLWGPHHAYWGLSSQPGAHLMPNFLLLPFTLQCQPYHLRWSLLWPLDKASHLLYAALSVVALAILRFSYYMNFFFIKTIFSSSLKTDRAQGIFLLYPT